MVGDSPVATTGLTRRFWLIALAALVTAVLTLQLGLWQLSRAAQKQAQQSENEAQQHLPALDNRDLTDVAPTPPAHRRVRLRGRWLAHKTVYLDNRQMAGRPGFLVLTPLKLERSEWTILIQRGWAPRNFVDRSALPTFATTEGTVEIEGHIAPAPVKLYEFDASQTGDIRQNLDLPRFAQELGVPLATYTVLQSGPPGDGLSRDWPPVNTGVDKHYGYAFQWFALCGLITGLFFWFQIVRRFIVSR